MDVLPRITRQLFDLYQGMSPLQRAMSAVVCCLILGGFGWLVVQNQAGEFRPVSFGKVFSVEELDSAEKAMTNAGLTEFRRDGRKLLAPSKELSRYNAALLESDAMPADLGTQMLKQYEKLGPFSTERQRQQMKEAFLLQELRRMIKDVPDVEDAHVTIAASERRGSWNQKPRATANVSLKPRAGRELSTMLIHSLRHVVANMVPDLKPADVTIFDVTRGQAYMGEMSDNQREGIDLKQAREFSHQYEQQIQKALSHIPGVSVTVHVDIGTSRSLVVRRASIRLAHNNCDGPTEERMAEDELDAEADDSPRSKFLPAETIPDPFSNSTSTPRSVQVCVSIPKNYLQELALRRMQSRENDSKPFDSAALENDVLKKVERIVGRLIPFRSVNQGQLKNCLFSGSNGGFGLLLVVVFSS